jgi:hypothetical protein
MAFPFSETTEGSMAVPREVPKQSVYLSKRIDKHEMITNPSKVFMLPASSKLPFQYNPYHKNELLPIGAVPDLSPIAPPELSETTLKDIYPEE